jgi:uracil-DNA glycosylase family 4
MDPVASRPATEQLENWLRYYEDLGIRLFFRDREPGSDTPAGAGSAATKPEENTLQRPKKPVPPARESAIQQTVAAPVTHGVAHASSLFESVERVAGDTLERIRTDLGECTRCKLHRHRNKIVFGSGNADAELMFVGEGPGHDEDIQGLPFVGRAGQLLTQMIEAMGLSRTDVYIANVVKCRPPENRTPEKDEVSTCMPYLQRQIGAIQPKVIVCHEQVTLALPRRMVRFSRLPPDGHVSPRLFAAQSARQAGSLDRPEKSNGLSWLEAARPRPLPLLNPVRPPALCTAEPMADSPTEDHGPSGGVRRQTQAERGLESWPDAAGLLVRRL